jgi:hypothetical protein
MMSSIFSYFSNNHYPVFDIIVLFLFLCVLLYFYLFLMMTLILTPWYIKQTFSP